MARPASETSWQTLYPFPPHWMTTHDGHRIHYVDYGRRGVPTIFLHGNPTWSFLYRRMISHLVFEQMRGIALDNMGCGLSDKPQEWPYRLANHVEVLTQLIEEELKLERFNLVLHDWGGPIGMGYAVRHPEKIRKLVLMNTAAYLIDDYPRRVALARCPYLGAFLVRGMNLFVKGALRMATAKPLQPVVQAGYLFPYGNWHDRIATQRFVQDLPDSPKHPTWHYLKDIEERLPLLADKPILLCWGAKDFCCTMKHFQRWRRIYPKALAISFPQASHFLMEDCADEVAPLVSKFLR